MDPVTMGVMGVVSAGVGLAGSAMQASAQMASAQGQADALRAQAQAEQDKSKVDQEWANRRALEERAAAQRTAGDYERQARLAQSRLGAVAGSSGSSGSDATVMNLWSGIKREGDYNAQTAVVGGEQKSAGLTYQAALDRWTADTNARIKRSSADTTLSAGRLGAAGTMLGGISSMAARYGSFGGGSTTGRTGYGIG